MKMSRAFLFASIAAGAIASQSASAGIDGESAYTEKYLVPHFVPDVRELIVNAAHVRGWILIDESPGELTFQLQHARSHMAVVAKAIYSKAEFSFRTVSAKTFQCERQFNCLVDPEVVHRWMIGLRREAGVALLRLAIQDAGGSVAPFRPAAVSAEPDESP
jgi:hypothetical protein